MKWLLALAVLFISSLSSAQKFDEFDYHFADVSILQLKPVQTDLGLTDGQRSKMNEHADWFGAQKEGLAKQVNDKKLDPKQANAQFGATMEALKKRVLGELTAAQLKRLREISLQREGLLPLMHHLVGDKIGLTTTQLKSIRDGFVKNDETVKQLQKKTFEPILKKYQAMKPKSKQEAETLSTQMDKELAAARKPIEPELTKLSKDFQDFVTKTLSKGQYDAFIALKGKPFKPQASG